ncbi:MAG: sugar-binding protein [Phycisphaerales bacterium]
MVAKRWLYAGLVTLLSLSVAIADPPAVHPTTGEPLVITCLRGTPGAIDGDLSDWNLAAMTPAVLDVAGQIYTGVATWTNPADCSGEFYVEWDDAKIYLAVIVKDEKLSMNKTGANIWNADCIEVFFSTTDVVATHTATSHYQYGLNANEQKWNWCNMDGTGEVEPAYLQIASTRTPDGYICEVSIEYARMASLDFAPGNAIGFHPCIDDTDDGDREIQMTWTSREAHDQTLGFGHILLSPDPAISPELSHGPSPAHNAVDVPVDAAFSWIAGVFAVSHDVYLGIACDDVNNAGRANPLGVLVSQGQTPSQFDPEGLLEYGQTYCWRVDEVNGAPDNTIFDGEVWCFTTEPFAYPITSPIAAKASSQQVTSPAGKTCDGSGLDDFDQHSYNVAEMWVTNPGLPAWIQYTFDREYKLHELWVWNANSELEMYMGFGAKDVTIECSIDGENWTPVENVPQFAQGTGKETYTANTVVSLGGVTAKHVRLTINTTWGFTGIASLSEVRFLYVPVQAFGSNPADGATEVALDATLSWRPGREAASHRIYFGPDSAAVAEGTATAKTMTEHSYSPGALDFGTMYYWRVDEVGDTGAYEGEVWSFLSKEYEPIDDFESYTDNIDAHETIWDAWVDGVTTKASGSQVGYTDAPFAERVIIHGGRQSMPLTYNNAADFFFSETERAFDPVQNWAGNGAMELSLWVRGYPAVTTTAVTETSGKITLTGAGTDIWGNSDEFTYAYKTLTGDGTLIARVVSNGNGSNTWAKGGVMIRDSVDGGATQAMMAITGSGGNGASLQYRAAANGASTAVDSTTVVAPPYWVKIERAADAFTGSVSADGKTWRQIGQTAIVMADPVLIGLAVTSHEAGVERTYQFDSIAATGTVTGAWQGAVIDQPQYNAAANMHLLIEDSAGKSATVTSGTAVMEPEWTQWKIPITDFAGVNFAKVKRMAITIGDKDATTAGGTGIVFIDDIGFGHSAE